MENNTETIFLIQRGEPESNFPEIISSLSIRHGKPFIRLDFAFNLEIIAMVKKIPGRQWSMTYRCWFVPDTGENRRRFGLSEFLQATNTNVEEIAVNHYQSTCDTLLTGMREKISLKAYSPHTAKNYINHIKVYLRKITVNKNPLEMTMADIEKYLLDRQERNETSESDRNSHINAIKFLYEKVLGRERMLFYLPRPKKPQQLPKVLSEHELERLFRAVPNLKHKTLLLTAFSCGLRVSEVTRLKVRDIDVDRMQVLIERAKGKKDRYVMLSPILRDVLERYKVIFKIKPTGYLFEGQEPGKPYSSRSAQIIFNRAVKAAGIHKDVTFHVLRASFATHLLDNGVDIKYIKELLGHFNIKTTERYLSVSREKLVHIQSPLDYLDTNI